MMERISRDKSLRYTILTFHAVIAHLHIFGIDTLNFEHMPHIDLLTFVSPLTDYAHVGCACHTTYNLYTYINTPTNIDAPYPCTHTHTQPRFVKEKINTDESHHNYPFQTQNTSNLITYFFHGTVSVELAAEVETALSA